MSQYVGSKWRKTVALRRIEALRRIIPKTVRFSGLKLEKMLQTFGMVYVKPDIGMHGIGVIRIENTKGRYRLRFGENDRSYSSYNAMYSALRTKTKGKSYLIQRGVHLLKYKDRRFDLRVMVQLNPRKIWETTGIIGRVAAARKIVTNYHNGGTLMPADRLLGRHLSRRGVKDKIHSLRSIGVKAGKAMRHRFPNVSEIGVDVGMDRAFTPWILEVNTSPDPYIFRKLPDPSIFKKIRRYAKAYGRR